MQLPVCGRYRGGVAGKLRQGTQAAPHGPYGKRNSQQQQDAGAHRRVHARQQHLLAQLIDGRGVRYGEDWVRVNLGLAIEDRRLNPQPAIGYALEEKLENAACLAAGGREVAGPSLRAGNLFAAVVHNLEYVGMVALQDRKST